MRIDIYLFENGFATSRTDAKHMIEDGVVFVNGKQILKASYDVCGQEKIDVEKTDKDFVSRGGYKLKAALSEFFVDATDKLCIDIGASSGGFTDCLLQHGAKHVIAVDSGSGQLAGEIRTDKRVTVFENYNARYMKPEDFDYVPDLAVMDVSFISATYIIPAIKDVLRFGGDFICLIKPQFEVGRQGISKGGIVKDQKARENAVKKVVDFAISCGFLHKATITSPIKGGDGNIEYLAHFVKLEGVL